MYIQVMRTKVKHWLRGRQSGGGELAILLEISATRNTRQTVRCILCFIVTFIAQKMGRQ